MTEIIPGLQGDLPANSRKGVPYVAGKTKVAACAKHYLGDGGTTHGIDENNTVISRKGLLSIHMPAYYNSIIKGVSIVMVSYSSWNGVKMHANHNLVTRFLKNTLRFKIMVPYNYTEFIDGSMAIGFNTGYLSATIPSIYKDGAACGACFQGPLMPQFLRKP